MGQNVFPGSIQSAVVRGIELELVAVIRHEAGVYVAQDTADGSEVFSGAWKQCVTACAEACGELVEFCVMNGVVAVYAASLDPESHSDDDVFEYLEKAAFRTRLLASTEPGKEPAGTE